MGSGGVLRTKWGLSGRHAGGAGADPAVRLSHGAYSVRRQVWYNGWGGRVDAVRFEWNGSKAAANARKHGVGFEEAATVFEDPLGLIFGDEAHSGEEPREIIIGHSAGGRLLLGCFTERGDVVRIISARTATKRERGEYEENGIPRSAGS